MNGSPVIAKMADEPAPEKAGSAEYNDPSHPHPKQTKTHIARDNANLADPGAKFQRFHATAAIEH